VKYILFLVLVLAFQDVRAHEPKSEMALPEQYAVLAISSDEVMWFNGKIASFRDLYLRLNELTMSGKDVTLVLEVDSGVNKQGEFYRQLVQSLLKSRNVKLRLESKHE